MIIDARRCEMMRAIYESGDHGIDICAGKVPVYIERTADIDLAVNNIIAFKTIDYGMKCLADQLVIFDDINTAEITLRLLKENGAHLCDEREMAMLDEIMFDKEKMGASNHIDGQSPQKIAQVAGFSVPEDVSLLLVSSKTFGTSDWIIHEKLCPILVWHIVEGKDEAIQATIAQLGSGGLRHTAVVFSNNEEIIEEFALKVPALKILNNQLSCMELSVSPVK